MALHEWTGIASSDWSNAQNWLPLGVPGIGDDAIFGSLSSPYVVNLTTNIIVSGIIFAPTDPTSFPVLNITGSLTTLGIDYFTTPGGPSSPVIVNSGGSLNVEDLIEAPFVPETITISGEGSGGRLELGTPATEAGTNVTFSFFNASPVSGNTGMIQFDNLDTTAPGGAATTQDITDVGGGDAFVISGANFTGDTVTYNPVTHALTVDRGATPVLTMDNVFVEAGAPDTFAIVNTDTIQAVCYARGTMLRTPDGEQPVEKLRPGKQVITLVDGQEIPRTVTWLGHRRVHIGSHPRPETVAPIRVCRDAFAGGLPRRDLVVSPDHAIFVDGKLICARQLVNGTTIRQEHGWTAVDYYHVELEQHAILLAEGLPAESYIDTGNAGFFANSGAPLVLHPDLADETGYPTREAGSCAPFVWDEACVRPVWQRLAERAAMIGQPVLRRTTTEDADLRLVVNRRTVKPIYSDTKLAIFVLPRAAREVRLLSRAQSPTEARPWLEDRRRLGVRVSRIVLRTADELHEVPVDHPDLVKGWWSVEHDGQVISRWTDGEAILPLPKIPGNVMLEVHLAGTMTFVLEAETEDQAARLVA
jgi:hypothetical protein